LGVIHIQPCGLGVRQSELHPKELRSAEPQFFFRKKNCGFRKRNLSLRTNFTKKKMNLVSLFFLTEKSFPTLQTTALEGRRAAVAERETASRNISGVKYNTFMLKHDTSMLKHDTSMLKHDTSMLKHGTSMLKHDTSMLKHDTSMLKHGTSMLKHGTSMLKHNTFGLKSRPDTSGVKAGAHALQLFEY
jgi:hypothetical protein